MVNAIVVGVDGSDDSLAALAAAAELGERSGAALVVVHVRHEGWVAASAAVTEPGAQLAMKDTLDAVERTTRQRAAGVLAGRRVHWRLDVALGDPASELIAAALDHGASAIVVGGRSHGVVGGLVVGSVAQKLVRHSPVSVLVVRDGRAHRLPTTSSGAPTTANLRIGQRERGGTMSRRRHRAVTSER